MLLAAPEGFIDISLRRQYLVSPTGTRYETVFHIMNELAREDKVSANNNNIRIKEPGKLLKLTDETVSHSNHFT